MYKPVLETEIDYTEEQQQMLDDAIAGLSAPEKSLPSKYFYDEEGSRIFDEITELEEYYPTRTETLIMRSHGAEMAEMLGPEVLLVEYGSGSSVKTRLLLEQMQDMAGYVPVDISGDYLQQVAAGLQADFPHIEVTPVTADFTQPFSLPETSTSPRRVVTYFPGSTIGNYAPKDAVKILKHMASLCSETGGVLIGADLRKPVHRLLDAYNDSQGVTARFNKNMLTHLNREIDCDFNTSAFINS